MTKAIANPKASHLEQMDHAGLSWADVKYIIEKATTPPSWAMISTKAILDRVAVLLALPFVLPLFLLIAVAIKLDSKGDVFFKQERTGFNGDTFWIYKFRSMTEVACTDEKATQSQKNDMRHTRVGRILRRTSLDELPQLINIFRGEMSLIGPRPHARYHDMLFLSSVKGYDKRFRVKPGLTGWAQVHGCRGFIETQQEIEKRTTLDNDYIDNWTLWKEISIIFRTISVVLKAENAH
jgi:putative colanic acid biosynthesis UDP-glucose lipid carrier transferase